MANAINIIKPYWYYDTRVFDDESVGLNKEPGDEINAVT